MLREGDQRVLREVIPVVIREVIREVLREVIPVVIRGVFTRAGEHDRAEELLVITLVIRGHQCQSVPIIPHQSR